MCELMQELTDRAAAAARLEGERTGEISGRLEGERTGELRGRLSTLTSLIKNEGFTPERTLKALGIAPEEWDYYLPKLS